MVVRDDLEVWQRINVASFLISGVIAAAGPEAIGEPYLDGDDHAYLPLLVQPVLVFETTAGKLQTVRDRAERPVCRSRCTRERCSAPDMMPRIGLPCGPSRPLAWTLSGSPCGRRIRTRTPSSEG